ncbi:plasmid pRiA4b ORF-3 family protein [Streptomyces sp. NPDC048516]|uniref:plasmid pRiA4b ORF-3 family protein n=1 Tax=Streptomyces sp. NPDC048516 TaxID=3365565 RepID=UPI003719AF50
MPADSVLQIKVTLADIHPPIWRRLQVPADLKLARLHLAIQTAMGWENYHMHLFTTPAGNYGLRDSEPGHRDERKAPLDTVAPTAGDTQLGYGVGARLPSTPSRTTASPGTARWRRATSGHARSAPR